MLALTVAVLLAAGVLSHPALAQFSSNYTEKDECQEQQICVYKYSVEEQHFGHEGQQSVEISTTVELYCHSVGEFSGVPAVQYCMTLRDTEMDGNIFNESTREDRKHHKSILADELSGWFCFVQTEDGKVVAVQHTNQSDDAVNFKKSIAAAFQANFKQTLSEEETDTQSHHNAHYSYEQTPTGSTIMHRRVNSEDIIEYSTGIPKNDFNFKQSDDIEYRNGSLIHSGGYTEYNFRQNTGEENVEEDTHSDSFTDIFSAHGSYTLDFLRCYSVPYRMRQMQSANVAEDILEENLNAKIDKAKKAKEEMVLIRNSIPSITKALIEIIEYPERRQLFFDLRHLLELEHQYGVLPSSTPAVKEIVDYLKNIQHEPQSLAMRKLIYTLLSGEGSHTAQMALFEALQSATSVQEKDAIIFLISTVDSAHIQLIHALEQEILVEVENRDVLLLSLGILASRAQPEEEHQIVAFLISLQENAAVANDQHGVNLIDLILAMGNTGSQELVTIILEYVGNPDEDIKVAAIRALLKFTHLRNVKDKMKDVLATSPSEEVVIMIVHTMVRGYQHCKVTGLNTSSFASHPILGAMVSGASNFNNTNLLSVVKAFLLTVGGEQAVKLVNELYGRGKRQTTTDWDSENSEYNLVASYSSRQSDVSNYPNHTAYLWQKSLGNSNARLKAAAGVFLGCNNDCENFKGYAKMYADGKILNGGTRTLLDVEILLLKNGSNIHGRAYVQIGSNVRTNYDRFTLCYNYESDMYQGQYRLFSFRYRIYIYVTTLDVDINVNLEVDIGFRSQLCANGSLVSAGGNVTGIANLDADVLLTADGSIHATLLGVARAGITAEVSFRYRPEARAKAKVCASLSDVSYQTCLDAHDSWPGNRIRIYAWYQLRSVSVRWCGGWIRYPCGVRIRWGRRRSVLSTSWSLGSRGREALIDQRCSDQSNPTCSAALT